MATDSPVFDFTKAYLEAGRRLTDRDLLRSRFMTAQGFPLVYDKAIFKPFSAQEHLWAELLADPEKASAYGSFYPDDLLSAGFKNLMGHGPELVPPWTLVGLPVAERQGKVWPEETLADNAVLDFQGRTAAFMAGAAVIGVAPLLKDFFYRCDLGDRAINWHNSLEVHISEAEICLPSQIDKVLVLGFVRLKEWTGFNPNLKFIQPGGGWLDLAGQAGAVLRVAEFLARHGYAALPSAGGWLMADQFGVLGGLGEVGRQGLLITPEFGPNIRLFTILTNYPFELDQTSAFGVADYCNTCQRCINECPAKAIPDGHRRLTDRGLFQWPLDQKACFDNWLVKGDLCRKCIEVCPYAREPLVGSRTGILGDRDIFN